MQYFYYHCHSLPLAEFLHCSFALCFLFYSFVLCSRSVFLLFAWVYYFASRLCSIFCSMLLLYAFALCFCSMLLLYAFALCLCSMSDVYALFFRSMLVHCSFVLCLSTILCSLLQLCFLAPCICSMLFPRSFRSMYTSCNLMFILFHVCFTQHSVLWLSLEVRAALSC